MFLQFLLYSKGTQPHIHILFFSCYLPSCSNPRDWTQFPALYSRTPLPIRSKCNSLHLPTPNSPSIPFSPPIYTFFKYYFPPWSVA